ncbi:DUF2188 domain-containing protein [Alcaligenes faecalis subsp. phenolicus]|uniref:DUF2188 domain-containing protein n=1 Tax=Alcaligenes nematophilus TaxID=2994643 RepID=UPI002AA2F0C7|nr:DUF2188 domain-containing protein [Alcaligenes phenolicus]
MDNYHITKDGDKWKLTKQGSGRASKVAETKQEILKATSDYMKDKVGSVKIHKTNGQIQEERTYPRAADPKKTRG